MPIYEYQCTACPCRFERKQSIHDEPVKTCPQCEGVTKRVLSPVGIIFKGSGFYVTDNRKSSSFESKGSATDNGKDNGSDKDKVNDTAKDTAKDTVSATQSSDKKSD